MRLITLIGTLLAAAAIVVPAAGASHVRSHALRPHAKSFHPDPMGCCGLNPTKAAY